MITQKQLKKILFYNSETGIFTWIKDQGSRARIGNQTGCIKHGYKYIKIKGNTYKSSRLAFLYMMGNFPKNGKEIDHINRIRNDDRWDNLREVSHLINQRNLPLQVNNISGFAGIYQDKRTKKWKVTIGRLYLGLFKYKLKAVQARKEAAIKYGYIQ